MSLVINFEHYRQPLLNWFNKLNYSLVGKSRSLVTGLSKVLVAVLTVTTLTCPSFPGWTLIIRPKGHFDGGYLSSMINTIELGWSSGIVWFHLWIGWYLWMYSLDQLVQESWVMRRKSCHRDRWDIWKFSKEGSCTTFSGPLTRKCPCVSTERLSGSSVSGQSGLEFRKSFYLSQKSIHFFIG